MLHKGVRWYHVESDGTKHPGRWKIAERNTLSVNMLFKTNTNGHKHPSISLIIIEQDTIGETKKIKKWHSTQEPRIPHNQSCRLWRDAASPILSDTPYVCIYTSYNENSYKEWNHSNKIIPLRINDDS